MSGDAVRTLWEPLDAMLLGWLERTAGGRPGCTAELSIARAALDEVEWFCAKSDMTVERRGIAVVIGCSRRNTRPESDVMVL
jgi:hypothetical protein